MNCYKPTVHDACPNCGKPNSAVMGSSRWGHGYSCCSEDCGVAFANSPARWEIELQMAKAERDHHARRVQEIEEYIRELKRGG